MKVTAVISIFMFSFFAFSQNWQNSFSDAVLLAKADDKPIILVFSGSDWCTPCIKLDKTIWQSEDFRTYADKNYILYKADFPRKKANKLSLEKVDENKGLAEKYNSKGYFPLVLVLNANEEILGTSGYKNATPKDYIAHLNSFLK